MKSIGHKSPSTVKSLGQKGSLSNASFLGSKSSMPYPISGGQSLPVGIDVTAHESNSRNTQNMPIIASSLEKSR
jgi:hypothetical protein